MSEPLYASKTTTSIGKIVTYYDTDGSPEFGPTAADELYQLIGTVNSQGIIRRRRIISYLLSPFAHQIDEAGHER